MLLESIQALDLLVSHSVQFLAVDPILLFFNVVTLLGHPAAWFAVAAVLYWIGRENQGFFLVNLTVFSMAATGALKAVIARPRPNPLEFNITSEPGWLSRLTDTPLNQFSFPSGHASLISTIVSHYWKKIPRLSWKAVSIAGILIVGLSRIILGQHFLSDVIGGIVLGIVLGQIAYWISKELQDHHFKLSKLDDALGLVLVLAVAIGTIAIVEAPAVLVGLLGFYAGFFASKEIGFAQSRLNKNRVIFKIGIGFLGLGLLAGSAAFVFAGLLQWTGFLLAGFWVSFLFPWLFEKTQPKGP